MTKLAIALIAALTLSACAGSRALDVIMEHDGAISVTPSETAQNEWIVKALPMSYAGYNAKNPEDRHNAAIRMVAKHCASPKVVSERVLNQGTTLLGESRNTYFITVRC